MTPIVRTVIIAATLLVPEALAAQGETRVRDLTTQEASAEWIEKFAGRFPTT